MIRGKKGAVYKLLIYSIGAIVFLVVFFSAFNYILTPTLKNLNADETCRATILNAARVKENFPALVSIGSVKIPKTNCKRQKLIIKKKDIVENGVVNQKKAHKIISNFLLRATKYYAVEYLRDPFSDWQNKKVSMCRFYGVILYDDDYWEFIRMNAKEIDKNKNNPEVMKKYFITSPVPYLRNTQVPRSADLLGSIRKRFGGKMPSQWEYIYNEKKSMILKEKELKEFEKMYVSDGSLILLRFYKLQTKGFVSSVFRGISRFGWAIPMAGYKYITGEPIFSEVLPELANLALPYAIIVEYGQDVFKNCPDCNAIGGIMLVPSNKLLSEEITVKVDDEEITAPICQIVVN